MSTLEDRLIFPPDSHPIALTAHWRCQCAVLRNGHGRPATVTPRARLDATPRPRLDAWAKEELYRWVPYCATPAGAIPYQCGIGPVDPTAVTDTESAQQQIPAKPTEYSPLFRVRWDDPRTALCEPLEPWVRWPGQPLLTPHHSETPTLRRLGRSRDDSEIGCRLGRSRLKHKGAIGP